MAEYEVPTSQEVAAALQQFGLDARSEPTQLLGGVDNHNLAVDTGRGRVVVRFYNVRSFDHAEAELALAEWLAKQGFPTPPPLRVNGAHVVTGSNRPVAVFPFVEGSMPKRTSTRIASELGSALAQLHLLSERYDGKLPHMDRLEILRRADRDTGLADAEAWRGDLCAYLDKNERWIRDSLSRLPSGAVHHDLHCFNLLTRDDERVVAVIDFDEVNRAPLALDVARTFHYIAGEAPDLRLPLGLARKVLDAYEARRPLERESLGPLFDLVNLVDAAIFLESPPPSVQSVHDCRSYRIFHANRELDFRR